MKSKFSKAFIFLSIFVLISYGLYRLSKSRTYQTFGKLVYRTQTSQKIVALTFDDAPNTRTAEVLNILKEKQVPATFYVIGQNIEQYPEIAQKIVNQGHELGNHSYSHKRMVFKTPQFIASEIETTARLIQATGYRGEITFRPPNGKKLVLLPLYLFQHGMTTVMWDVEPDTYFQGDKENIVKYTLDNTTKGSIILIHPFCETVCQADREALPEIIDGLRSNGYRFVTIAELLALEEY